MSPDRRFHRTNGRIAHESLRGQLPGVPFTGGVWHSLAAPVTDLCAAPAGPRDRQLLLGTRFCVLDQEGAMVFGFEADDGYCGWIDGAALGPEQQPTHWVQATASHLYAAPDLKSPDRATLSMGARLCVEGQEGHFARTNLGYVPLQHLRNMDAPQSDPAAIALQFLGVPYLWGGNSHTGIDCSGLVQIARRACALPCPPDSDLQRAMPGIPVAASALTRGDLIFWKGHVAMVSAPGLIVHANGHHMAVTEEPMDEAINRMAAQGAPVLARLRAS